MAQMSIQAFQKAGLPLRTLTRRFEPTFTGKPSDKDTLQKRKETISRPGTKLIPVQPIAQGHNACGTTSLAMVLNTFGQNVNPTQLDEKYRAFGLELPHRSRLSRFLKKNVQFLDGTPIRAMLEAARAHGVFASVYNHSGFEEIREHIDQDRLPVVYFDTSTEQYGPAWHYAVVNGYRVTDEGERFLHFTDPSRGGQYWLKFEDFAPRWEKVQYREFDFGYHNTLLVFSKNDDLPPERMDGLLSSWEEMARAAGVMGKALTNMDQGKPLGAIQEMGRAAGIALPNSAKFIGHKLFRKIKKPDPKA